MTRSLSIPAVVRGRDRADGRGESTGGWAREPSGTRAHAGHPELRRLSVHGEAGVDHHGEQREFVDGDGLRRVVGAAGRGRAHHQVNKTHLRPLLLFIHRTHLLFLLCLSRPATATEDQARSLRTLSVSLASAGMERDRVITGRDYAESCRVIDGNAVGFRRV